MISLSGRFLINTNKVIKVTIFPVLGTNNTKQTMRCFLKSALSLCPAEWKVARASATSSCPWMAPSPSAAAANTSLSSTVQPLAFPATPVSHWQHPLPGNSAGAACEASVFCPGYWVCAAPVTDVHFHPWERMRSGRKTSPFAQEGLEQHP